MNTIIARIKGGLGNQLFCYAAARRLAIKNNAELVIDDVSGFLRDTKYRRNYELDRFNITARKATPHERMEPFERYRRGLAKYIARQKPFFDRRYIEQETKDFDQRLLEYKVKGTVYLDGLWQSEKYFKDVEDTIRKDLCIVEPSDKANLEMAKQIISCNAVAIHVRWFDEPNSNNQHNIKKAYYSTAINEITKKVQRPHFFIFSDKPDAAKQLLQLPQDMLTIINHNKDEKDAYIDLWLVSQCRHFIIANSTFSWWGAWLSSYRNKIIIVPRHIQSSVSSWGFKGLIPERWIQV